MGSIIENPVSNLIKKIDRIESGASEARRVVLELEEIMILEKERLKNRALRLNKKLIQITNLLEDETNLNDSMMKENKVLKNRLDATTTELKALKETHKKVTDERDTLKDFKNRKRKEFKRFLKNRLKGRKKIAVA